MIRVTRVTNLKSQTNLIAPLLLLLLEFDSVGTVAVGLVVGLVVLVVELGIFALGGGGVPT